MDIMAENYVQVVVIGGGVAGLAATEALVHSGVNVILVEAANYLGGRVKQVESLEGWPLVDVGGEIIHGCKTKVYQLAMENNWEMEMLFDYEAESRSEWIFLDGQMYPYHSTQTDILGAYTAWGDFVYSNKHDANFTNNDISAAEYLTRNPELSQKSRHIFNVIFCQTEAANLETFGAQEHSDFQNGWECGPGNYRLKNSHKVLVDYFISRCQQAEIKMNWEVKEIDYSQDKISVTNHEGEILHCKAVIICVPLTVFKDQDINFKPHLPQQKLQAIEKLQMHTGLKIVCRFTKQFWPEKMKLVFNCTSNISQLWMYSVRHKETGMRCHVVTGFQTAEYAKSKAYLSGDEVKDIFLHDLDQMFGTKVDSTPASDSLIDFVYHHWSSSPYIRGAYSSPSLHARGSRETLARPISNRVYFAGEATRSTGDCASVSGAIESGIECAEQVKLALKHSDVN